MKKIILFLCLSGIVFPGYAQANQIKREISNRVFNALSGKNTRQSILEAAKSNQLIVLKQAVRSAFNSFLAVNVTDEQGRTPLMWACKNGNVKMIDFLLQSGARMNEEDDQGRVALEYALRNKQDQAAVHLAQCGATVRRSVPYRLEDGSTQDVSLFALALWNGMGGASREILARDGRFFGNRIYAGWSVLDKAVAQGFFDLADKLVDKHYVYTFHAVEEAFKAGQQPLFKRLVQSSRWGFNEQGYALRALVQSDSEETLDYVKILVEQVRGMYDEKSFRKWLKFRGYMDECPQYPFELAVRQDVREYLASQGVAQ